MKLTKKNQQQNIHSQDQLNQQINDKLSQLWTGMKNKRKQLLRNLTPSYSRRSQRTLSQLNATHTHTQLTNTNLANTHLTNNHSINNHSINNQSMNNNSIIQNQLLKMKQKLASQQSGRKLKQTEIQRLKNTISQLTNDKKILIRQIQNFTNHSISLNPHNQSHHQQYNQINEQINQYVDGRTANFYPKDKRKKSSEVFNSNKKRNKSHATQYSNKQNVSYLHNLDNQKTKQQFKSNQQLKNNQYNYQTNKLQDLSKDRLIQLLRSTSQYRQFAFYYDSHELSYLKRLQQQHRKNCQNNYSSTQKKYWAPQQLLQNMKMANNKNKWGLNQTQLQEVISQMKGYFQNNQQIKIKQTRDYYLRKIQKLKRQKDNKIPYDLVRLSNARERQICKKRTKSIKH